MEQRELVEVKFTGYTAFLTKDELNIMLKDNPDIWKQSIQRGKHILRARRQRSREAKKFMG